ncbi:MAG: CDP-diacylglycerol--glycerol-3-phosphate 3-phosphatidyltransferase [Calditrichia bacterium]
MHLTIPNQLTLLRILLTPVFISLILSDIPKTQLAGSIVFLIAAFTDWYDGWHARKFGVITRWGQFMDPLADKILVASAFIVYAMLGYVFWWMIVIIIIRDFVITAVRIYALAIGSPVITHILAKWKTALQMFTIMLILAYINARNFFWQSTTPYQADYFDPIGLCMSLITLLTLISGAIYFFENRRLILHIFRKASGI